MSYTDIRKEQRHEMLIEILTPFYKKNGISVEEMDKMIYTIETEYEPLILEESFDLSDFLLKLENEYKDYNLSGYLSRNTTFFDSEDKNYYDRLVITYVKNGEEKEFAYIIPSSRNENDLFKMVASVKSKLQLLLK